MRVRSAPSTVPGSRTWKRELPRSSRRRSFSPPASTRPPARTWCWSVPWAPCRSSSRSSGAGPGCGWTTASWPSTSSTTLAPRSTRLSPGLCEVFVVTMVDHGSSSTRRRAWTSRKIHIANSGVDRSLLPSTPVRERSSSSRTRRPVDASATRHSKGTYESSVIESNNSPPKAILALLGACRVPPTRS